MNKHTRAISNDVSNLAEDARALVTATVDAAGEKISEARERLSASLENGKELYGRARDQVVKGAKAADEAFHEHPYRAMCVAVGIGALVGYLCARRASEGSE